MLLQPELVFGGELAGIGRCLSRRCGWGLRLVRLALLEGSGWIVGEINGREGWDVYSGESNRDIQTGIGWLSGRHMWSEQ